MTDRHSHRAVCMCSRRDLLKGGLTASAAALLVGPSGLWSGGTAQPRALGGRPRPPADSYLDVARKAERWIARSAQRGRQGTAWPADPGKPETVQLDLYNGMPGVVLFYLELFSATRDARALAEAETGADHLIATLPNDASATGAGLYEGLAGIAYTLELTHRASGDARYRDAATRALALMKTAAHSAGSGVEWSTSTDIISGSAGIGLFLLWANTQFHDPESLQLATQSGKRLIERGQEDRGGMKWLVSPEIPRNYPNFSHGTAGVSYFLACLYQVTNERAFLGAARAGATYLDAVATTTPNNGRMVFHSEPGNEQLFYLSWCHGPAGTARLYHRLAEVTSDHSLNERVGECAQAIIDMKVPDRSPGFWNNISRCCGNAGVTEFFIALHRHTKDPRYLAFAEQVTADTLHRASEDESGMKWVQAENRVSPEVLVAQTGLMQGAAGVGIAMLHLDGVRANRPPFVVLPDDPF
jgi:lantibiotic modifying enzyme